MYVGIGYCRMLWRKKIRADKFLENRPNIYNRTMVRIISLAKELLTRSSPEWKIVLQPFSSNFVSVFITDSCCNWFLPKQHFKLVGLGSFIVHFLYIFHDLDSIIFKISSRKTLALY